ncbi:MAG: glycerophosphodiester phosphodiesterase [Candidatus Binataceae bacterium]|nr:glycerophosphodiester phosphodiesterase [Candidatus Binataceae bacterium]
MRPGLATDFFAESPPRAIAHRGASGDYPENTLIAFAAARDLGAPYIELDVRMTREGRVVVAHDEDLGRVAGRGGLIRELTLAELSTIDAAHNFAPAGVAGFPFRGRGIRVPELAEVFAACPGQHFIVEIKQTRPSLVPALLDVIDRAAMGRRVLIASELQGPIDEVRAAAPSLPTNFPTPEVAAFMMSLAPGAPPLVPRGDALQVPPEHEGWKIVTAESVAAAHRLGVEVHVWTVNDASAMRAMLAAGADGIITDYPACALAILDAAAS